jgi:4-hydroxy-tetrahydrodipicolinate reductase
MIRVAVSGAAGRMGRMAAETVAATEGLELSGGYDPRQPGTEVAGITCVADPAEIDCDVVIEFSIPDVVIGNLGEWGRRGFHAVVGTSGFDAARLEELDAVWPGSKANCLVVPNFSIGAVVMMRFAELAAPHFGGAEVVEMHHDKKVDYPSGTALATAARMAAAGAANVVDPAGRGTAVDGIPIHSIRLPGIIASQQVLFGGVGETLSIRHDTFSREAFMPGVLAAVRAVAGLPDRITVGLDSVLGL